MNALTRKKVMIIMAIFIALTALLVIGTGERHAGRYRAGLAPLFRMSVAPANNWQVQSGLNVATDGGVGAAGNYVEFPLWPGYRAGLRLFSPRWWTETRAS